MSNLTETKDDIIRKLSAKITNSKRRELLLIKDLEALLTRELLLDTSVLASNPGQNGSAYYMQMKIRTALGDFRAQLIEDGDE